MQRIQKVVLQNSVATLNLRRKRVEASETKKEKNAESFFFIFVRIEYMLRKSIC